jgi:hypothetical protein
MMITKALALWLFIVGVVWAFVTAWIDLVMTGFTDRIVSLPVFLISSFSGPLILVTGSLLVMAMWHGRLGTFLILAACAWLTWLLLPDYTGLLRPKPPLEAPRPYLILALIAAFVLAADAAAVILFRRVAKPSNQSLQPTAGRRTESVNGEL